MIRRTTLTLLVVAAALFGAAPTRAQYMFLDFDGDGAYTITDQYGGFSSADTTNVDVYVVTNQNWDGSTPTCPDGSPLDINAYTVHLVAHSAPVTFVSVTNRMAGMSPLAPLDIDPYALTASYGGPTTYPPGKYRLMSLRVLFGFGCRNLMIEPSSCFSPPGLVTSFGSSCPGPNGDYTIGPDMLGSYGCTDLPPQTPAVTCPAAVAATLGQAVQFTVSVDARACDLQSFSGYDLPAGASVTPLGPLVNGIGEATFTWTPMPGQAGVYDVHFEAHNNDPFNSRTLIDIGTTRITVSGNTRPIARVGGPYTGIQNVPVPFDASHSSDPDGDALTYAWQFGDGAAGSGTAPLHTYVIGGAFTVVLQATDPGGLFDKDSTTATIRRDILVRVFTSASNDPTRLGRGKPLTCFQIEAADGSFTPDQIAPASVFLRFTDPVCGELEAYTTWPKAPAIGDADRNGVLDYGACFSRDAMETLGMCLPQGTRTVPLELYGALTTGDRIHGAIQHTFISNGPLQAAILPNPVSAASTVEFTTKKAGSVRVRIFDIRGRLAGTLYDEAFVPAGRHQVGFAALDRLGTHLASGVYFVRISSEHDGEQTSRVTVLK